MKYFTMNILNESQIMDRIQSETRRNLTESAELTSGYDLPPYGLDNGVFYFIHIPAIVCIFSSLICAITSLVISFRHQSYKTFFSKWTKSERFVVYMALCDGLFNMFHSLDHTHMAITADHVYPRELCVFYAFCLNWLIPAQMLLVNVIALTIFMLMYFNKDVNFGRWDWRLLLWTFGFPLATSFVAAVTGQYGPANVSCFFDTIKGRTAVWFTTVPAVVIIVMDIILYILTWKRIRDQASAIKEVINTTTPTSHASRKTARTMSLFVTAFLIQWVFIGVYFFWDWTDSHVHPVMFYFVVTFPNLGGCFNLVVILIIRRKRPRRFCKSTRGKSDHAGLDAGKSSISIVCDKTDAILQDGH